MRALETYKNNTYARKPKGYSGFKKILSMYKNGAKKRNLEFKLSEEQFKALIEDNCYYCGMIPNQISIIRNKTYSKEGQERSKYKHNGVDRINSEKGYTLANSVSCCKTCNFAKLTMGHWEFVAWIVRVFRFQEKKYASLM